jgi:hypothetical protein
MCSCLCLCLCLYLVRVHYHVLVYGFIGRSCVSCFSLDSLRPWPARVRYLRLSVGLVLGGDFFYLAEKLACSTKGIYSTDVFQMVFF